MEAWNNKLGCMGSWYQSTNASVVDRRGLLEGKKSLGGGFVIFPFLDMVKMDEITHGIFLHFSRENNKIRFLKSPSSLLKGIGARPLDHPRLTILLCLLRTWCGQF